MKKIFQNFAIITLTLFSFQAVSFADFPVEEPKPTEIFDTNSNSGKYITFESLFDTPEMDNIVSSEFDGQEQYVDAGTHIQFRSSAFDTYNSDRYNVEWQFYDDGTCALQEEDNALDCTFSEVGSAYEIGLLVTDTANGIPQYASLSVFVENSGQTCQEINALWLDENFTSTDTFFMKDTIECQKKYPSLWGKENIDIPPAGFEEEILPRVANPFSDTDITDLTGVAAASLYHDAIIGGFPDGEHKGYKNVSRGGAVKFLLRAKYGEVNTSDVTTISDFPDLVPGEWYVPYIRKAVELGIMNGYETGMIDPGGNVKVGQFLKMLAKTFALSEEAPSPDPWFSGYLYLIDKYNLFPGETAQTIDGYRVLTRDDVAVAIYQFLKNQ